MHSEFLPQLGRKPSLDTEQIKKTTRMMRMHDEECNVSHVLVMLTSLLCLVVSLVVRWLYTLLFTQFDLCKVSTTNLMVTLLNFINMALTYSSLLVLCTYTTFTLLFFHLRYTVWYYLYLIASVSSLHHNHNALLDGLFNVEYKDRTRTLCLLPDVTLLYMYDETTKSSWSPSLLAYWKRSNTGWIIRLGAKLLSWCDTQL